MATEFQDDEVALSPKEAADTTSPKQPRTSKRSKSSGEANAKDGTAEPKESKPKGSGRADCLCFVCNRMLPLSEFSGSQKKKKRDSRKCLTCALLPIASGVSAPRTPRNRKKADAGERGAAVWYCLISLCSDDDSGSGSCTDDAADAADVADVADVAEGEDRPGENSGSETDDEVAAAAKAAAKAAKAEKKKKKKKRGSGSSGRGHKKSKSSTAIDDENGEPRQAARDAGVSSSSGPVGRIRNPGGCCAPACLIIAPRAPSAVATAFHPAKNYFCVFLFVIVRLIILPDSGRAVAAAKTNTSSQCRSSYSPFAIAT